MRTGVVKLEHSGLGRPHGASVAMNYVPEGRRVAQIPMTVARFQPERLNRASVATKHEFQGLKVIRMARAAADNESAHRRSEFKDVKHFRARAWVFCKRAMAW